MSESQQEVRAAIAERFRHLGIGAGEAAKMAYGRIYAQLIQQAQTLACLDVLLLGIFCGIMVPAVLLTRRVQPGAAAMGH
jgi:formate/nitrite transporter FocA (FNT family)